MSDGATLRTLADLAEQLGGVSVKTARRHMAAAMQADPTLHVIRRGRTILLTTEAIQRIIRALEWRSHSASAATSGTRAAPSASVGRRLPSHSSAQDAAREAMRLLLQRPKKPASARTRLTALPGGRSTSP